jgi:hypothetical protein
MIFGMTPRRRIIASALIILPIAVASAAPNPDARKITACLENANEKSTSGVECIGSIADPCITAAVQKDFYMTDQKACAARELAVWTGQIASHTQSISRNGKPAIAAVRRQKASIDRKALPDHDKIDPGQPGGGTTPHADGPPCGRCNSTGLTARRACIDRLVANGTQSGIRPHPACCSRARKGNETCAVS